VSSVSSKTEKAWTTCNWCAGKVSYERKYKWDPYDNEWVETTTDVPTLCRKCKSKKADQDKLRREEANLDRKLEQKEATKRVSEKRARVRNWTQENR